MPEDLVELLVAELCLTLLFPLVVERTVDELLVPLVLLTLEREVELLTVERVLLLVEPVRTAELLLVVERDVTADERVALLLLVERVALFTDERVALLVAGRAVERVLVVLLLIEERELTPELEERVAWLLGAELLLLTEDELLALLELRASVLAPLLSLPLLLCAIAGMQTTAIAIRIAIILFVFMSVIF